MKIVIKKQIDLEFLGETYKDSYIIVRAISMGEIDSLKGTVKDEVISRFITGKIQQDNEIIEITKENIEELPAEVFVEAFAAMSGASPKVEGQLNKLSSMEPPAPQS